MPTILTSSQQTFVDITDQRKLSAYITSNLPKTQSENPNVLPHTYAPSTNLTLTPVVFLDQTNVALNSSGLTITWKRKDGSGAETALNSNEKVTGGILKVNSNVLATSSTGMITYICYISYYDSETKNTVNITCRERKARLCDSGYLCIQVQCFFCARWCFSGNLDSSDSGCLHFQVAV